MQILLEITIWESKEEEKKKKNDVSRHSELKTHPHLGLILAPLPSQQAGLFKACTLQGDEGANPSFHQKTPHPTPFPG